MSKKRSKLEMCVDILRTADENPLKKTRLMAFANVNHKVMERILPMLLRRGFIELEDKKYKTTERGKNVITTFDTLSEALPVE